ncbi:MAG: hypothetical protein IT320_19485 [Anaerolineae bacterium]|nr:hypothetical protein [Anaerolineae bacterium]
MAVDLRWLDEDDTVLHFVFRDPWTMAEFSAANEVASVWLKARKDRIDAVFDMSNAMPPFMGGVQWADDGEPHWDNLGRAVVVCNGHFVHLMTDVANRLMGSAEIRAANSLDDAVDLLLMDESAYIRRRLM